MGIIQPIQAAIWPCLDNPLRAAFYQVPELAPSRAAPPNFLIFAQFRMFWSLDSKLSWPRSNSAPIPPRFLISDPPTLGVRCLARPSRTLGDMFKALGVYHTAADIHYFYLSRKIVARKVADAERRKTRAKPAAQKN